MKLLAVINLRKQDDAQSNTEKQFRFNQITSVILSKLIDADIDPSFYVTIMFESLLSWVAHSWCKKKRDQAGY